MSQLPAELQSRFGSSLLPTTCTFFHYLQSNPQYQSLHAMQDPLSEPTYLWVGSTCPHEQL